MTAFALAYWDYARNAENRFRRIITTLLLIYLIFGIVLPFIHLVGLQNGGGETQPERYAQLLKQAPAVVAPKPEEPKPAPENKPQPQPPKPQKQVKPQPTPRPPPTQQMQVQRAREVAQHSGLLAMSKQLADLRADALTTPDSLLRSSPSQSSSDTGASNAAADFAASAGNGSNGIATAAPGSAAMRASGTGLSQRRTASVKSPIGFGRDHSHPDQGGDNPLGGRSLEEIQLSFDRSKGAFYAIFNRAMREDPNIGAGKIVVSITIAPDGSVTDCHLVSSSFGNVDLERKVVERVKMLNFGAKNVPPFTYPNYPINFLPS